MTRGSSKYLMPLHLTSKESLCCLSINLLAFSTKNAENFRICNIDQGKTELKIKGNFKSRYILNFILAILILVLFIFIWNWLYLNYMYILQSHSNIV